MTENAQCQLIKEKIVDGYRRGVCTADGGHIPKEKRGMAGKGSHYIGRRTRQERERFRTNYDLIDWSHK